MPQPSNQTAWDFMPPAWTLKPGCENNHEVHTAWLPPEGFQPITQLEHARLGTITPEMERIAKRELHLTAVQIRDEITVGVWAWSRH